MIFGNKRATQPLPDSRAPECLIKITCPLCGASRDGDANEVLSWQTEHPCRTVKKKTAA